MVLSMCLNISANIHWNLHSSMFEIFRNITPWFPETSYLWLSRGKTQTSQVLSFYTIQIIKGSIGVSIELGRVKMLTSLSVAWKCTFQKTSVTNFLWLLERNNEGAYVAVYLSVSSGSRNSSAGRKKIV